MVSALQVAAPAPGSGVAPELSFGNIELHPEERSVYIEGTLLEAGKKEVDLLEVLMRKAERVVTREALESSIYSMDDDVSPNALDAIISRLRRHLKESEASVDIRTSHGVGYSIVLRASPK